MACRIVYVVSVSTALSVAIEAKSVRKELDAGYSYRSCEKQNSTALHAEAPVAPEAPEDPESPEPLKPAVPKSKDWWENIAHGVQRWPQQVHLSDVVIALIIPTVAVIAWYALSPAPRPVVAVMSTVPRTPLSSLVHRDNQVIKTRGVVAPEMPGRTVNSPLMSSKCLYAHATIQLHDMNGWKTIMEIDEAKPFLLKDDDMEALVEISAAAPALTALKETGSFEGDMAQLPAPIQERLRSLRGNKFPAHSYFKVQEEIIVEGDCIEAFGLVVRRVQKGASRCALTSGGLSASNADRVHALFPAVRVQAWREVGNRVLLVSAEKEA